MTQSTARLDSKVRWGETSRAAWVAGAFFLGLASLVGCGSDRPRSIGGGEVVIGDGGSDAGPVTCEAGSTRACSVKVSEHNGVIDCYQGIQVCEDGVFGPCQDGTVIQRTRPPAGMHVMSLSDAGSCEDNPCDPSCQVFDEVPDAALSLEGGTQGPEWVTAPMPDIDDNP